MDLYVVNLQIKGDRFLKKSVRCVGGEYDKIIGHRKEIQQTNKYDIHLHIHHMSRIPFLILSFLDFVFFVVRTLIFLLKIRRNV